jgi:lipid-binding SYLF domain-containing protein
MRKIFVIFLTILYASNLFAKSVEEEVLEAANSMQKLSISKNGIPKKIIKESEAIVIVPGSWKVGFLLAGKYGEGVASIRKADRTWSNPFFVTLGGGSLGFQLGVEAADTIFVFRTTNSVKELLSQKFTLGVGASAAAGPMSTNIEKNSEINMQAEIFSYSQNKGLFAGASFEGASISNNDEKNRALYGNDMSVLKIVNSDLKNDIYSIKQFSKIITNYTGN